VVNQPRQARLRAWPAQPSSVLDRAHYDAETKWPAGLTPWLTKATLETARPALSSIYVSLAKKARYQALQEHAL
jgi:hypothetical protein